MVSPAVSDALNDDTIKSKDVKIGKDETPVVDVTSLNETKEEEDEMIMEDDDDKDDPLSKPNSWSLVRIAIKLKIRIASYTMVVTTGTYLLLIILMEKDYGIIPLISNATNTNKFYLSFVGVGVLFRLGAYFILSTTIDDILSLIFQINCSVWVIIYSIISRIIFNSITMKQIDNNDSKREIPPSNSIKVCLFLISSLVFLLGNLTGDLLNYRITFFFNPKHNNFRNMSEKDRSTPLYSFFSFFSTVEIVSTIVTFALLAMIIAIGSISHIPDLDSTIEIVLFGYLFPILKAALVSVVYMWSMWQGKKFKWNSYKTAKLGAAGSGGTIMVCTLSQLYVIFSGASNYQMFVLNYVPHEVIKKVSMMTYHPLYIKMQLKVIHLMNQAFKIMFGRKEKVDPVGQKRFTAIVQNQMNEVAADIIGRQFGEDFCMVVLTIWVLPITQEYLVPSNTIDNSLPSYIDIGTRIIGIAYALETVLTIVCYILLLRVGIPLESNTQVIEYNKDMGYHIFTAASFILVMAATFSY